MKRTVLKIGRNGESVEFQGWSTLQWVAFAIAIPAFAFAIAAFVMTLVFNGQNVKTITGVPPKSGEVTEVGGLGIAIVPNVPTSELTIVNTGVLSDIAGPGIGVSAATGDVTISNTGVLSNIAGTGISVSAATGDVTVSNTGVTSLLAGPAISVSAPTGAVTVTNTGVRSAIAGTAIGVSGATGDVTFSNLGVTAIAVGSGISTTAATGSITLANTGVLSIAAVDGLAVDVSTGAVTASHVLTTQTALSYGDANGPQVSYLNVIGFFVPLPENTWGNSPFGFIPGFIPGILPSDGGQGDVGGSAWVVPAVGSYIVAVSCDLYPSAIDIETHQSVSVALAFNANDVDPFAFGLIPIGAYQTIDLNTGTLAGAGPILTRRISFTSSFQACSDCPVLVGDLLTVHARMDHTSTGASVPLSFGAVCILQMSRVI